MKYDAGGLSGSSCRMMGMRKESVPDIILQGCVFVALFAGATLIMNIVYRPIFGLLIAIIGVLTYHLIIFHSEEEEGFKRRPSLLPSMGRVLLVLHLVVIPIWLFVPPSPSLYFANWGQIPADLWLRALVSISYACLVPGALLVMFLDVRNHLSSLEVLVLGAVSSMFFSSLVGYILYTAGSSLQLFILPSLWVLGSLFFILRLVTKHQQNSLWFTLDRPPSFATRLSFGILVSILAVVLLGTLVINVQWYALLGGDLWTHAAQTAYFLQGDNTVTYPWAFHFLVAALWGVSGLPIINVEQVLQIFTILPVLALFVTVSAYSRRDSRIPILSTLFFALFQGLGWISYLYLKITVSPSTLAGIYGIEYGASAVTYDIAYGVLGIRFVFIPAILALSCLILALRFLRGFRFPWPSLIFLTLVLTFLSTTSHLIETAFFAAVLLIAAILKGEMDEMSTLVFCELGAGLGLGVLFIIDWFSPLSQRIFTSSSTTSLYAGGFSDEVYLLVLALGVTLLKIGLMRRSKRDLSVVNWIYSRVESYVIRVESRFVIAFLVLTGSLAVLFTIYAVLATPFSVWDVVSSASVPWNYYPIRLGVVTFFAFVGSAILILHLDTVRRYFEFFILASIAIVVGRLIDLFGGRPFNFGEDRIMDILWVAVAPLAGFGLTELTARLPKHLKLSNETRKTVAAVVVMVIIFAGTASFLLLVDKASLQGQIPGYAATNDDMQVISYIIQHRNSLAGSLTAPTLFSQFKIREMTLTYPLGYFSQFSVLPLFQSSTIAGLFKSVDSVWGTYIFVSSYDVSHLVQGGYLPSLWFLAFQPALVDAYSSFLLSPLRMNPSAGSASSTTILSTGTDTINDFFGASALALITPNYSLGTTNNALPTTTPYIILPGDTSNPTIYDSALAWARVTGRTLIIISNSGAPGLFESQLFRLRDSGVTFTASEIRNVGGGSSSLTMLPVPLTITELVAQNSTIVASYENGTTSSPLASLINVGSGRVIFISLREYYDAMSQNMFDAVGRELFHFLPDVFGTANIPLSP